MQKFISFIERYAASVLRYGLAAVILWFSLAQFLHNGLWTAYIPDSIVVMTHLGAPVLVFLNAVFELVFGLLLVFGWQTRIVALLLALHLFDIMYVVGYGEIGVRDFGLAIATLVIFMNGPDPLCVQQRKRIPPTKPMSPQAAPFVPGKAVSMGTIDSIRPPKRFL